VQAIFCYVPLFGAPLANLCSCCLQAQIISILHKDVRPLEKTSEVGHSQNALGLVGKHTSPIKHPLCEEQPEPELSVLVLVTPEPELGLNFGIETETKFKTRSIFGAGT
jgi:hypothetical protein